jgi:hypothetical protein
MRPSYLVLLAAAALVAACDSGPTQPAAPGIDPGFSLLGNVRVPITFTFVTCNLDVIDGSGIGHFANTVTQDAGGTFHVTNHIDLSGRGVAEQSGATYLLAYVDHLTLNLADLPAHLTEVVQITLVGQGGAQNLVGQFLLHVTVDANGVVTAFVDNERTECH